MAHYQRFYVSLLVKCEPLIVCYSLSTGRNQEHFMINLTKCMWLGWGANSQPLDMQSDACRLRKRARNLRRKWLANLKSEHCVEYVFTPWIDIRRTRETSMSVIQG